LPGLRDGGRSRANVDCKAAVEVLDQKRQSIKKGARVVGEFPD
jgi:hypothetical protein